VDLHLGVAFADADVQAAWLFGSRATGRARPDSDADVAVLRERALGLYEREQLAQRLAAVLGVPDVDVVDAGRAPLEIQGRVVQEGRLLYEADPARRVAFEVLTRSRYFDYLPTLRAHTRRWLAEVAREGLPRG
jgi:predicted nucleotidyltransferase